MTATSTALIQRVCYVPLARAVRTRAMPLNTTMNFSTTPTPSRASPPADSRVLLGLSEPELQQLALDFSQVMKTSVPLFACSKLKAYLQIIMYLSLYFTMCV